MRALKSIYVLALVLTTCFYKSQINVVAKLDHVETDGIDTVGNIDLTVSGGNSPYNFTWSPASNGNQEDFNNAPVGDYSVTVEDAWSNLISYNYKLGYKTDWKDFYYCISRNDSLLPNGGPGSKTAVSKNVLKANENGWMQIVYTSAFLGNCVGFLDSVIAGNQGQWYDIDIMVHVTTGNAFYVGHSYNWYYVSTINNGDVLRIEKNNNNFYVKLNGTTVHTLTATKNSYQVKGFINSGSINDVGLSFKDTIRTYPLINKLAIYHVLPDGEETHGSIINNVSGGVSPIEYTWNPGNIDSKDYEQAEPNTYTYSVKDATNDSIYDVVKLGYKSLWKNHWGTTSNNDTLWANAASTPSGSPSAYSINELRPGQDGWIQYIVQEFSSPYVVGIADTMHPSYRGGMEDVNFALHITTGNAFYAWNGSYWNYIGTSVPNDVLEIKKTGTNFYLFKNGTSTFSTSSASSTKNYRVKAMLNDYIHLPNVGVSFKDSTSTLALTAIGFVNHLSQFVGSSDGSINLKMYGGKTPYTYKWLPGNETSKSINNLNYGTYSLTVKDAKNDSIKYVYELTDKVIWSNLHKATSRNDSLFPDDDYGPYVNSSAYAVNVLEENQDGAVSITMKKEAIPFVLGFCDTIVSGQEETMNNVAMAMHVNYGILYAWNGNWNSLTTVKDGDVLEMKRENGYFKVYKNGTSYFSQSMSTTPKMLKALVAASKIAKVGSSFLLPYINPYAVLKKEYDGGYYIISNDKIRFKYDGEYNDGNLQYQILDGENNIISGPPSLLKKLGDNRYYFSVASLNLSSGFYKLEVINEKNEKFVLKMKK